MKTMTTQRIKTRAFRLLRTISAPLSAGLLLGLGSCIGPNPGFFVSTSAANASIMTVVSTLVGRALNDILGAP